MDLYFCYHLGSYSKGIIIVVIILTAAIFIHKLIYFETTTAIITVTVTNTIEHLAITPIQSTIHTHLE